jgi:deazaflavin-dependent oxidoreductase (nitroreductase family)
MSVMSRVGRWGNELMSSLYRRYDKPMFRTAAGMPILLITVAGRKSGTPYTTPVGYFMDGDDYVVCGSAGGAKDDPQWFRNLRHAGRAHVEVAEQEFAVAARVVPDGPERDRLMTRLLEVAPRFAGYQGKIERKGGTRRLPLAVLTRDA